MLPLLLATNIFLCVLIFLLSQRLRKIKLKNQAPSPIPSVSLEKVDPIFAMNDFGTTTATEVAFVGRAETPIIGAVSDSEGWILSVLAKKSKNIFEFGTCTGRTTYLLARNSPNDAVVTTLTLSSSDTRDYYAEKKDDKADTENAIQESGFTKFFYSGTDAARKIKQLYGDSKKFDEAPFVEKCDLIFVDGSHAYSYVVNDSQKALQMVKSGGLILWHDYIGPYSVKGVYQALNELSKNLSLLRIEGTRLVVYRKK